jgi:Ca-activated chloride channel family protein
VLVATLLTAVLAASAYALVTKGKELLSVTFQEPWFLLGLILVPPLLWRTTFGQDRRLPRIRMGTLGPLGKGPLGFRTWLRDVPGVFRATGVAFMVLALARPVSSLTPSSTEEEGIDLVLVLDLSGSMKAAIDDLPPELSHLVAPKKSLAVRSTRLDAAKAVIRDFVARRKTDRIGVVAFGKEAYVLSPPTLDYHLLDALVSRMELNLIDGSATAIGDALGVAVARLRRSQAASKAIVLLTDGDNNAGKVAPEYAAHLATVVGARVYTVQIGEGDVAEVFDGFDLFGQPRYETVSLPANPELLKTIAEKTSGRAYVATDARALQASLHDVLDQLEKTQFESNVASFEDLYRYLLLPGVLLAALDTLLRAIVLRRFP